MLTCSPSLAKSADRMEGDTMMSFLENLYAVRRSY